MTSSIWLMRAAVGRAPVAPLRAVDAAQVAVLVRPLVPDRHAVFVEIFDVRVAAQKPEQLVNDGLGVQLFRGEQRETIRAADTAICAPNTEYVPVPVRSALNLPCSRTCRSKSRY